MPKPNDPELRPGVPPWLLKKNPDTDLKIRPAGTSFITKTLHHFSEVFENEFFCERYAVKPMLLQGIDPRVKVLVLFGFMLFSAFASSLAVLLALAVIALAYARLSGLNMKDYLRRVWAYIPLILFLFSLPGASSLFAKGTPLFTVLRPGTFGSQTGLYFTAPGIAMAFRLALRPGISLSFAFLLLLTTRWNRITGALARMRVPLLVVSILNMTYRYIFVMADIAGNMMEARFLRTVGRLDASENRRFMSRSAAHMFLKSHLLSEEIYDAMVCRGFAGRPVSMERFKIGGADIVFLVNNILILIVLIAGEHLF